MTPEERYLPALVDLAVEFGADVQAGQVVIVPMEVGQERLARAAAVAAYRRGARYVDVEYWDPHVKLARLQNADRETLEYVPPWIPAKILESGEQHAALVNFFGETEPDLFAGVDPELLGLDILPRHPAGLEVINKRQLNWTMLPGVTPAWARTVFPDLEVDAAVDALWEAVAEVCRLNEPDPVAAWRTRFEELQRAAGALDALALDRVHFRGPGTDLSVGLLPGSRWLAAEFTTSWGLDHHPNLPTEEVFTTPDPERVDGWVTATRPLLVPGSAPVHGLRIRFEGGRAVSIEADSGAAGLEAMTRRTDGGARLGEMALVDRSSRVGQTGRVFSNILLDENAVSHLALGGAYELPVEGEESLARINRSDIHIDFMIGSDEVDVTGVTRDGEERVLLHGGEWQI